MFFLLGGIQEDVSPWYWMHFFGCAALLKPLIGQLDLLTCLSLCISPVENRRFNECRVRCSTRGTTTSQTMRHLSYHLSSLHFWHHSVGWNCQGDQEDELSMEDLHETTARIHALLDAEAALVTWMQDNRMRWPIGHNERLYVVVTFFQDDMMRPLFSDVQCNQTQYKPQISSLTYHDMIRHLRDFLHTVR